MPARIIALETEQIATLQAEVFEIIESHVPTWNAPYASVHWIGAQHFIRHMGQCPIVGWLEGAEIQYLLDWIHPDDIEDIEEYPDEEIEEEIEESTEPEETIEEENLEEVE